MEEDIIKGRVAMEVAGEFGLEEGNFKDEVGDGWKDPRGWIGWWPKRYARRKGRDVRPHLERAVVEIENVIYMRDLRVWGEWIEIAGRFMRGECRWDIVEREWRRRQEKEGGRIGVGYEGGSWHVDVPRSGAVGGLLGEGYRKAVNDTFDLILKIGVLERMARAKELRGFRGWVVGGVMRGWGEVLRVRTERKEVEGRDLWEIAEGIDRHAKERDGVGALRGTMVEAVEEGGKVMDGRNDGARFRRLVCMCRGWEGEKWDGAGWFKFGDERGESREE